MNRSFIFVVLITVIAGGLWAESEWVVNKEDIKIPEGYEEAWSNRFDNDEIFYKMMQLGRGVSKGDRLVFEVNAAKYWGTSKTLLSGEALELGPIKQDDGSWAIVFFSLEKYPMDSGDKGEIVVIFPELPMEMKIFKVLYKGYLFARYEGIWHGRISLGLAGEEKFPVLIADQLALEKVVFSVQSFKHKESKTIEKFLNDEYELFTHYKESKNFGDDYTGAIHYFIPGDSYNIRDTTQEWSFYIDNSLCIANRETIGRFEYKYSLGKERGIKTLFVMSNNWELGEPLDGMIVFKLRYEVEDNDYYITINEEGKAEAKAIIGKLHFLAHTKK